MKYVFEVYDEDGLWYTLSSPEAESAEAAKAAVTLQLQEGIRPHGSPKSPFRLELIGTAQRASAHPGAPTP